jgi:hypothetical protein
MALIGVVTIAVLTVVSNEARISGSDLERTQTFYAAASGLEKMTSDFSNLYRKTAHPTQSQLNDIAAAPPDDLVTKEKFTFSQTIVRNQTLLDAQILARNGKSPVATVPTGPFAGLIASVEPFHLTSVAVHTPTKTQVRLERDINNYLIPLFQFGTFGDKDLEFWPEPPMSFNGRVHANGNIYFGGDINFLDRVTTAGEAVRDRLRNNATNNSLVGGSYTSNPRFTDTTSNKTAKMTVGSVVNGPNLTPQPRTDGRGYYPDSPAGTENTLWPDSTKPLDGTANHFGDMLKTASTGARKLLLPLQLDGRQPYEIIKRSMPDDNTTMSQSRYHNKATVRILIDDEALPAGITSNAGGIPTTKGVLLSKWTPSELNGGNALRVVDDSGNYLASGTDWYQGDTSSASTKKKALTVRGVRNNYTIVATGSDTATGGKYALTTGTGTTEYTQNFNNASTPGSLVPKTTNGTLVPPGSGIKGRILIEIVDSDGVAHDVTQEILSMGVTVGEPNAIVHLQRPLWAAFMQGSRDRMGGNEYLTYFTDNSRSDRRALADGEINISTGLTFDPAGFLNSLDTNIDDDPHVATTPFQPTAATMDRDDKPATSGLNQIVPINVYNVREGHITDTLTSTNVYSRGITSVVELNMRNLARWLDGVYDNNLLANTAAVSGNIDSQDGWIVYVSDRRGDRVKKERNTLGADVYTTNGMVDNEDIYNYPASASATPEPGEDVLDDGFDVALGKNKQGSLQHDLLEIPDPTPIPGFPTPTPPSGYADATDFGRALAVGTWDKLTADKASSAVTDNYFFRRAVRLFNGENLQVSGGAGKLSATKGLTVATENMVYIWGNYNTTGITGQPTTGSTVNDPNSTNRYSGNQVPASIAADAFFPLSKTWFDSVSAMYPEGYLSRVADAGSASASAAINVGDETSVRAGIIAGTTDSAMVGTTPSSYLQWLNGGVHNFPRFLETWGTGSTGWEKRWNYVGSYIILYNSTQALGPWSVTNAVNYYPPKRNWAFDITFTDPNKLPPGTPQFQFIQATGFRQTIF